MMKRYLGIITLAAFAFAVCCANAEEALDSQSAILRLINTRAAASPKAFEEAAKVVARDAANGKALQQYVIAIASMDENATPSAKIGEKLRKKYLEQARPRIKALAEKRSNALAWYLLALESNDLALLRKAADAGNIQAMNAWGTISLTDVLSNPLVATNETAAVLRKCRDAFARAAALDDANGLYNLGMCHMRGYGGDCDFRMALECFRKAAIKGHPEAMNNIGGFYRDGIVVRRDASTACAWFAKSADKGNIYGMLNYALALSRGDGIAADPERAAKMLKECALSGSIEAMNAYAECLRNGVGCKKDPAEAAKWFLSSAREGFAPAMEGYAASLEEGYATGKKDLTEALAWRMRSRAARGDRNAAEWLSRNGHSLR